MKTTVLTLSSVIALTVISGAPVVAQEVTGELGSPTATTTITGKQLPPPPPPFGGVIKEKASESTPWWPPRVVPPKGAPNVLLIMTDDQGFGAPSTFGGVIPTPSMDRIANLFYSEAKKYDVLPLDNSTLGRWNAPRPSLTAGQTVFTYSGELSGVPGSAAPRVLDKSYTITADVEIPDGGAEGMIVTEGGRFGGYGPFLSKGEFGVGRGKVVFLYNLLDLKRTTWEGPELEPGKHTIVFDFKSEGDGLGKGGTGVLSVDGKEVAKNSMDHTIPVTFPEDETFDVGQDTRTGVALVEYRYDVPFKFTGKIDK